MYLVVNGSVEKLNIVAMGNSTRTVERVVQGVVFCVFNSSELMVVGNATRIVKAVVYPRCQWQCRKLNIVAMGNSTRTVEGVVNACCLSRCICCFNAGCVCWLNNH